MTLWDIAAAIIRDRWSHRRQRRYWMTEWPYWTKQSRFNILQRYLMRRGLWIVILLVVFRVNPFHPLSILVTIIGVTLMWTEHKTHQRQHRLLFNIKRKGVLG